MLKKERLLTQAIENKQAERKKYKTYTETYRNITGSIISFKESLKDFVKEKNKYIKKLNDFDNSLNKYDEKGIKLLKPKILSWADIISLLKDSVNHHKALRIGDNYYTITKENKKNLISALKKGYAELVKIQNPGSDVEIITELLKVNTNSIDVISIPKKRKPTAYKKLKGRFFKYTHNLDIDLSRYQLYNKLDENSNQDNCFIHGLVMYNLPETVISQARHLCNVDLIPLEDIKKYAKKLNLNIMVRDYDHEKDCYNSYNFNNVDDVIATIKYGLIDNHYFLNDTNTGITSYALEHLDEVINEKDYHRIFGKNSKGSYMRSDRYISSIELIKYLLLNKESFLKVIDESSFKSNKASKNEITTLEYNENQVQPLEFKERKDLDTEDYDHVFLDFETSTMNDDRKNLTKHEPYQVHMYRVEGNTGELIKEKTFNGELCGLNLLKSLKKDSILFAHNFKYDINFLFKYTFGDNITEREGKIISGVSKFYNKETRKNINIIYRDTFHMISKPIKDFPKMFKLDEVEKEIMPYSIYTPTSTKEKDYSINKAKHTLKDSEREGFLNNIKKWNLTTREGYYDHIKYSEIYCKQDVNIMFKGYMIFKDWMKKVTGLNIINYPTISSIAYAYGMKEGIFEGCYELNGTPRIFIDKCKVGGRNMTANNEPLEIIEDIQDFDGVSLYPSSMYTLGGFLKGKPKVLKTTDFNVIKNYDGYFIEIDITKINKTYDFPLMSRVNENGIRIFDNNLLGIHYVDKISLEDMIKFHQIEFKIIKGYYFDEGRNDKIREVIKHLFDTRKEEKKKGNPIQEAYKLAMNSIYGKTLLKYDEKEVTYINEAENALGHISRNYEYVNSWCKLDDCNKYRIQKIKTEDDHYSSPHIGVEILSNSKRIMNEVMCLAYDLGIKIYYQDTDSMHIQESKLKILEDAYFKMYNKVLVGEDLCQFHCDFDFKCDKGTRPVSTHFIGCGKKTYCDKVKCIRDGKEVYEYHVRLKGIPNYSIKEVVDRDYEGDYIKLYQDMKSGKVIEFNLLCDNKVKFEFTKSFTVKNRETFKRRYCINDLDEEDDE